MAGTISTTLTSTYTLLAQYTTVQSTGGVSASSGSAILGPAASYGWTLVNAGTLHSDSQYGVALYGSGNQITNLANGLIFGGIDGIDEPGGSPAIYNAGTIQGAEGIIFQESGTVTNVGSGALITGEGNGIYLNTGGSIYNGAGATIFGDKIGVWGRLGYVNATNGGTIQGNTGVALASGGQLTNLASGVIIGDSGNAVQFHYDTFFGPLAGVGTLDNLGIITAASGFDAVSFYAGPTNRLIDNPGAVFIGTVDGGNTIGATAASTLELASGSTAGTLDGLGSQFINFANVYVDNGATWTMTNDTIGSGYRIVDSGTLTNLGSIGSTITLALNAVLTNAAGGTITSGRAVLGYGSTSTVVNAGLIQGVYGVYFQQSGNVANNGGTILGGGANGDGIISESPAAITNTGLGVLISGPNKGIYLNVGGSLYNGAGATIFGSRVGLWGRQGFASATNAGTIEGGVGLALVHGASVTNLGSGVIIGDTRSAIDFTYDDVVDAFGGAATVTNFGIIEGASGHDAVLFRAGFANRLIDNPGAVFTGAVDGANTLGSTPASTLELASGSSTGTLDGLGSQFINFANIYTDAGATWTLTNDTIGSGYLIIDNGTLTNTGSIGETVTVTQNAVLTNAPNGTIGFARGVAGYGATPTIVNAGLIQGYEASGPGVFLGSGGFVTNLATGTIDALYAVWSQGPGTVVNAGTLRGVASQALKFVYGYDNLLVIDPGAVFIGQVQGGNTPGAAHRSTIELAAGTATGTLNLAGGQYVNFSLTTVDATASWTVNGTVTSTMVNAGYLNAPLTLGPGTYLNNQSTGTIAGTVAVGSGAVDEYDSTIVNSGRITNQGSGAGIYIRVDALITNQSGGIIQGYDGIASEVGFSPPGGGSLFTTVINDGSIESTGSSRFGVYLYAVNTLINAGQISATGSRSTAVELRGESYAYNSASGTISGMARGIYVNGSATIVNAGLISAGITSAGYNEIGIDLTDGGSLTNKSTGTISAYYAVQANGTVVNDGQITGNATFGGGVKLVSGSLTNQSNGTISGQYGVKFFSTYEAYNQGLITGGPYAFILGSGVLSNASTGRIISTSGLGVYGAPASPPITLINDGTVSGGAFGVQFEGGGVITNSASGTITGSEVGIGLVSGAGTVFDAGTIAATGSTGERYAIGFGANFANRLVLYPGATFVGTVGGGNLYSSPTHSSLDLASGTSAGTISGLGHTIVDFEQIQIDKGAIWSLTGSNAVAPTVGITNAGTLTLSDASLVDTGTLVNNGVVLLDPSTLIVSGLIGTGSSTIGAGATLFAAGTVGSGQTIDFHGGNGVLQIGNYPVFAGTISGLVSTDTIDLPGLTYAKGAYGTITGGQLTIASDGSSVTLSVAGIPDNTPFDLAPDTSGGTNVVLCFLADTQIATPSGQVPVQTLRTGDMVMTASGIARPIAWIGTGRVLAVPGRRNAATPVIVRKGALEDNVPNRDLRVTKGHSLFIDNVLVPVEFLVNHRSILWDDRAQEVEIYHIELETHDVLVANGALAESYRDDGNRWLFRNADDRRDAVLQQPCATLLTGGPVVDAIWLRVLQRAGARPGLPLTDDPDLHLLIDGERVDGRRCDDHTIIFQLAKTPANARVISRASVPQEIGLARDDRMLGVAVSRISLWQGRTLHIIEADALALCDGFYDFEPDNGHRWTNGNARLPDTLFADLNGPCTLVVTVSCSTQYPLSGERLAA